MLRSHQDSEADDQTMVAQRTLPFCRENHRKRLICVNDDRTKGQARFIMYTSDTVITNDKVKESVALEERSEGTSLNADEKLECQNKAETKFPGETRSPRPELLDITGKENETRNCSEAIMKEPQASGHSKEHTCDFFIDNSKYSQVHSLKDEETFEENAHSSKVLESNTSETCREIELPQRITDNSFLEEPQIMSADTRAKDKAVSEDPLRSCKASIEESQTCLEEETLVPNSHQSKKSGLNEMFTSQPGSNKRTQALAPKEEMDIQRDKNSEAAQSSNSVESEKAVQVDSSDMKQKIDIDGSTDQLDSTEKDIADEDCTITYAEAPRKKIQKYSSQGTRCYLAL